MSKWSAFRAEEIKLVRERKEWEEEEKEKVRADGCCGWLLKMEQTVIKTWTQSIKSILRSGVQCMCSLFMVLLLSYCSPQYMSFPFYFFLLQRRHSFTRKPSYCRTEMSAKIRLMSYLISLSFILHLHKDFFVFYFLFLKLHWCRERILQCVCLHVRQSTKDKQHSCANLSIQLAVVAHANAINIVDTSAHTHTHTHSSFTHTLSEGQKKLGSGWLSNYWRSLSALVLCVHVRGHTCTPRWMKSHIHDTNRLHCLTKFRWI